MFAPVCRDLPLSLMQVIVDDEVTKSFSTEEVEEWNFLTRTQVHVSMR